MNDPEIKPAPSLPWYRAIVTRTPRGRKLRRRTLMVLALLTVPKWPFWFLGLDLKVVAAKLGLRPMPSYVFDYCWRDSECDAMRCRYGGRAVCALPLDKDPSESAGKCMCLPPEGCPSERLRSDGKDWECLGGERDGGP